MPLYRRLLAFLRPHWWRLVGNVGCNVIGTALDGAAFILLIPFLNTLLGADQAVPGGMGWLSRLMNALVLPFLVAGDKRSSLLGVIGVMLVLVIIKNLFLWMGGQIGASLQERLTRDLRDTVFHHMQRLPLGWFSRTKTGQIMARILTDTEQAKAILAEVFARSVMNLSQIVVTIVILVRISPRLALISLVIAPLITAVIQPILRRLRTGHRSLRNEYGEITSVLQEVISGVRLVKSFQGEPYEDRRFSVASGNYTRGMIRITRLSLLSGPLTEILGTVVAMMVLWFGAELVFSRHMEGGTLLTFMTLVMRLLPPLKQLSQAPTTAQQSLAAAERLFEVLDHPTEAQTDRGSRQVEGFTGTLAFEQVGFSYGDAPVLQDITLTARRGDVVALVGSSGAGKSTLVDLIPRFIEPTTGRITLDGVDTRDLTLPSLRALTGIVSQDTVLFNDTVRANIAYGLSGVSQADVEAAARAAHAHDFITRLPQGYETMIGDRGMRLSGGQRQRIALARAILKDAPILLLDEATSALDSHSERLVQEALARFTKNRTTLVIAHRLSTVQSADLICVMHEGRLVESGTHADLLSRGGAYARLARSQFGVVEQPDAAQ